jgi:hypothetical protein
MSDWKLEDKEWLKQRKKEWPQYKFNIIRVVEDFNDLSKQDHDDFKSYFLTGDSSTIKTFYKLWSSVLLELWLHPSEDLEILKQVFKRHCKEKHLYSDLPVYSKNDRNLFCLYSSRRPNRQYKGMSPLNGREWVIDQAFMPQSLEAYIELEGEGERDRLVRKYCLDPCYDWGNFLTRKERFDNDICVNKLHMWKSAIKLSFEQYKDEEGFVWLIEDLDTFLASNEEKHPKQIKLAQDIVDAINDPEMPQGLRDRVAEIRASNYATK